VKTASSGEPGGNERGISGLAKRRHIKNGSPSQQNRGHFPFSPLKPFFALRCCSNLSSGLLPRKRALRSARDANGRGNRQALRHKPSAAWRLAVCGDSDGGAGACVAAAGGRMRVTRRAASGCWPLPASWRRQNRPRFITLRTLPYIPSSRDAAVALYIITNGHFPSSRAAGGRSCVRRYVWLFSVGVRAGPDAFSLQRACHLVLPSFIHASRLARYLVVVVRRRQKGSAKRRLSAARHIGAFALRCIRT